MSEELASRLAEAQQALVIIGGQKRMVEQEIFATYPQLEEGGKIVAGKWTIESRLFKQSDCNRWERRNNPINSAGYVAKLKVTTTDKPIDPTEEYPL